MNASCKTTVLQRKFLQQFEVHVIADANGEDADLTSSGFLGVAQNLQGIGLPEGGFPIREEDDEGHAPIFNVILGHVIVEQFDGLLQGPIDVCTWRTSTQDSSWLCSHLLPLNVLSHACSKSLSGLRIKAVLRHGIFCPLTSTGSSQQAELPNHSSKSSLNAQGPERGLLSWIKIKITPDT